MEIQEKQWEQGYELQRALRAIEEIQLANSEDRGRLDAEIENLRTDLMRYEVHWRQTEAENEELRAQIQTNPARMLLDDVSAALTCPQDSLILQQITALKMENEYLRAQKQAVLPISLRDEAVANADAMASEIAKLKRQLEKKQNDLSEEIQRRKTLETRVECMERDLTAKNIPILPQHLNEIERLQGELAFFQSQHAEEVERCRKMVTAATGLEQRLQHFSMQNPVLQPFCYQWQRFLGQFDFGSFSEQKTGDVLNSFSLLP
jgi:hypothetical protein